MESLKEVNINIHTCHANNGYYFNILKIFN